MSNPRFESSALFALPRIAPESAPEKGLLSWSRPFLIEEVRKRGVDMLVVRGADSIDEIGETAHNVIRPEYSADLKEVTIHQIGTRALESFDMMRSIVARKSVDHILPVLNPTALRILTADKFRTADELLGPIGLFDRQIAQVRDFDDIENALDSVQGATLVAKPNNGLRSIGVVVGSRNDVRQALADADVDYVVEERLNFSPPLPMIRGEDDIQQARLDSANQDGVNKEVRLYSFGEQRWHAVGRIAKPGETDFRDDKWLYIDQDSVPVELLEAGEAVLDKAGELTGTSDVNVGIDFVYASTDADDEPRWRVMEVNSGEPQLVQLHEHEKIGRWHHEMLADQIVRTAVAKRGSV